MSYKTKNQDGSYKSHISSVAKTWNVQKLPQNEQVESYAEIHIYHILPAKYKSDNLAFKSPHD